MMLKKTIGRNGLRLPFIPLSIAVTLLVLVGSTTVAFAEGDEGRAKFVLHVAEDSSNSQQRGQAGGSNFALLSGSGSISIAAFRAATDTSRDTATDPTAGLLLFNVTPGNVLDLPPGNNGLRGNAFDLTRDTGKPSATPGAPGQPDAPTRPATPPDNAGSQASPFSDSTGLVKVAQLLNRDEKAQSTVSQMGRQG